MFGALLSSLGTIAGMFGGGRADPNAQLNAEASIQNNKLRAATDTANQAAQIAQRAGENQLTSLNQNSQLQQAALRSVVDTFGRSLLRNLGR